MFKDSKKFKRLLLLIKCLLYFPFLRKANRSVESPYTVIVVLTGKLGDIVCGTPVLYAIRKHLPNTKIILAHFGKIHVPLLQDSMLVDQYLDLETDNVVTKIRLFKASAAFVTGPSFVSVALLYLSGIPLITVPIVCNGFSPAETRLYKIVRKLVKTFPYHIGEYAPRERLRSLESIGIYSKDVRKHLGYSSIAEKEAHQFFISHKIDIKEDFVVGISLSAGNKIKEWPVDRFAKVAQYLYNKYHAKLIITGNSGDESKVQEFLKYLDNKTIVIDTVGQFNIDIFKAIMSKFKLFISVDSGPIYIAEAFDVPTVDITGPIDEKEQPPKGLIHRNVIPSQRTRPELFVLNSKFHNKEEVMRQVNSITVKDVCSEIDILINYIKI